MNKPKEKYLSIEEIASNLGLLESDVGLWVSEQDLEIRLDHRNRESISSSYMDVFSSDERYENAKRKSLESENHLRRTETPSKKLLLKEERANLLEEYSSYISDLEHIHRSCLERTKFHHHESSVVAAYLLFSKVISSLKLGVLALDKGFWFGGSVIREIDEALDLAHYFMLSEKSERGKSHLHKWFRQNRSPQHHVCREEISRHYETLLREEGVNHKELMNELYQAKSKWTHPTYSLIREITQFDTSSGIEIGKIEYGIITFETKLIELTHFFRSSIWSSFQVFMICFSESMPLTDDEQKVIMKYDRLFQEPSLHEW